MMPAQARVPATRASEFSATPRQPLLMALLVSVPMMTEKAIHSGNPSAATAAPSRTESTSRLRISERKGLAARHTRQY
jgi:predicted component of type VI protein secretion system